MKWKKAYEVQKNTHAKRTVVVKKKAFFSFGIQMCVCERTRCALTAYTLTHVECWFVASNGLILIRNECVAVRFHRYLQTCVRTTTIKSHTYIHTYIHTYMYVLLFLFFLNTPRHYIFFIINSQGKHFICLCIHIRFYIHMCTCFVWICVYVLLLTVQVIL